LCTGLEPTIFLSVDSRESPEVVSMTARQLFAILVFTLIPGAVNPVAAAEWRTFKIPESGLNVDIPATVFTEDAGPAEGTTGRVFYTADRRADLTIKAIPNAGNDSPASFLAKMQPPARIQYRRVTDRFFAVSSIKNGRTWYNRCNRAGQFMNCVLINYPAAEDRQWDAIVTRISLSLAP
jgi:hypothetical protein